MLVEVPVSVGELVDKLTILDVKAERIADPLRLAHIKKERSLLMPLLRRCGLSENTQSYRELFDVNLRIWAVEDAVRACRRESDYGHRFLAAARRVQALNEERYAIKARINAETGSEVVEVKSYAFP